MPNFSYRYKIIYKKYLASPESNEFGKSKLGMARFLNATQGRAQHWESGRIPNAIDCLAISDKLGFKLRWVISGEEEMIQPESVKQECIKSALSFREYELEIEVSHLKDALLVSREKIIALQDKLLEGTKNFP